ncbi:hypothetical protein T07_12688 [Trichinella nelsoni]|uniref:Uncharacterized protein n=1 Tax=Trichinella nelsoni TaxID=6336 RepID=A0A0V0RKI5_9BILA|nr:hypothetical protein T07_12688 [Trichinella nelsoni]
MHCYVGEDHQQKENNPTVLENNQADGPSRAHKTDLPSLSTYPITNDKVSVQNDNRAARPARPRSVTNESICPIEQL